ncbi:MAG: Ig-like domain-containing protein [Bacteroidaceae bacterium]|nr:Ig-like domain-containing protein [Bacteroidaceae bacterium]
MKWYKFLSFNFLLFVLMGCASIGSPDGGAYDEDPPKLDTRLSPNDQVHFDKQKFSIYFDEYIKLENPNEKVIVSPPQSEMPSIRAEGKRIRVELFDKLLPNTTYTVDFSDAVQDNNEGNPMGLFTYSFSTGDVIDSMEVSGTVLDASNLEPVKGILVGLYPSDSIADTTFRTKPLLRVGRTNGSGRFTIKGVANGSYRAYALKDMDGDYRYSQKSEMLAFDTLTFTTSSKPDWRVDTAYVQKNKYEVDSTRVEKYSMKPYIHYYPDDLVLLAFLEEGQPRHFRKAQRKTPEMFTLFFEGKCDSLPIIEPLNFDASSLFVEANLNKDTINYWIPDTNVAYQDTLRFNLTYLDTDTLGNLVSRTDSLMELVPEKTHARIVKEENEKLAKWEKERQKMLKKGVMPKDDENPLARHLEVNVKPSGTIDPNQNVTLLFAEPIVAADTSAIHFRQKVDSVYQDVPFYFLPDEDNPRLFTLLVDWEPKAAYEFKADSLAFRSIMGLESDPLSYSFRVRGEDEFGSIFLNLSNLPLLPGEKAYAELLDKSDKPVAKVQVEGNKASFYYLKFGDYYVRLFVDRNDNGTWDTGNYDQQLQPEDVYYFPKPLPVRNTISEYHQDWNVRGIPRDQQKALAITKQKPDKKKDVKERNRKRNEELLQNQRKR